LVPAVRAALGGFEAAVPDWEVDPDQQSHLWQQIATRRELTQQLKLIERIDSISLFDERAVKDLRKGLSRPPAAGKASPRTSGLPGGLTNQTAFEQYRRMVESDLRSRKRHPIDLNASDLTLPLMLYSVWLGRYSRRLDTIKGNCGHLADSQAQQALVAR